MELVMEKLKAERDALLLRIEEMRDSDSAFVVLLLSALETVEALLEHGGVLPVEMLLAECEG